MQDRVVHARLESFASYMIASPVIKVLVTPKLPGEVRAREGLVSTTSMGLSLAHFMRRIAAIRLITAVSDG
jgi:hypothetical protein